MSHYFINDPNLKSSERQYAVSLFNMEFNFVSDHGVFSKDNLDYGSKTLLLNLELEENQKTLLDIGCGIGVMGIILKAKYPNLSVTMSDVNTRALSLALTNKKLNNVELDIIESNLFDEIPNKFDVIISNPPIRIGKQLLYQLYKEAHTHLNKNGSLWLVVRKQQGAKSTIKFLETIYSKVEVIQRDKGFYIIKSIT